MRKLTGTLYEKGEISEAYALAAAIDDVVQATGKSDFYAAMPYGVCPICGDCEELLRVGNKNYAICHKHGLFWYVGVIQRANCDDIGETEHQNRNLLETYTQLAICEVFPTPVCPCCGQFRVHAPWCIVPMPDLEGFTF